MITTANELKKNNQKNLIQQKNKYQESKWRKKKQQFRHWACRRFIMFQLTWLFDWSSPYGNNLAVEPFCTSLFFVVLISLAWIKWKSFEPDVKLLFELDLDVFVVQMLGFIEPFLWLLPLLWCIPFVRLRWCDEFDNCDDCRLPVSLLFIMNCGFLFLFLLFGRTVCVCAIFSRYWQLNFIDNVCSFSNDTSSNSVIHIYRFVINCSFVL